MNKYKLLILFFFFTMNIFSQPAINSIVPNAGPVGTIVTIKGIGFDTIAGNNVVYFGAVKATISSSTDTTLTASVPYGTNYAPVTVTVNNLSAYSPYPFIVTFPGGSGSYNANSFLPAGELNSGAYPHCVLLGDFNQDGRSDVLVSRGSSDKVTIFPNISTGDNILFAPKIDFNASGNNHEGGAIADFDGDGKLDFVITNTFGSNSVSIFRNISSGSTISFATRVDYSVDNSPYSVAAGDLDGDGKPDLAVANNGSDKVTIYKNESTPGNISFTNRSDHNAGTNPYSVAIGDLNGDGKPELIITTQGSSNSLSVMKNISVPGTISLESPLSYASMAGGFVVAIGDFDGDGKPDLAGANAASNSVLVIKNLSSSGLISFGSQQYFSTGNYPVCVSISDLDGDGKPDLVTTNRFSDNVSALKNISSGGSINFENHVDYPLNDDPFYVVSGDLNNDSRPEIIGANSAAIFSSVLKNIIGANISPTITSFTPGSGINGTIINIVGTNFTGTTSVKFGGTTASSFVVDSATHITAVVGTGAGGEVSVTTGNGTATMAGFIFNGPIITSFNPMVGVTGTIVTITGTNFTGATQVKFGVTIAASFIVNSSTTITATVGAGSSGSVSVTTANGTATLAGFSFGAPTITSINPVSGPVGTIVTINGTNFNSTASGNTVFFGAVKATVISATSTQLTVSAPAEATYQPVTITNNNLTAYSSMPFNITFPNDTPTITTNSFAPAGNFGSGTYPVGVTPCDLNDDGKPDLITVNSVSNNISILKNTSTTGTISFSNKIDFTTGPGPRRIAIGDLDGDGKPDIVITNFNAGNASSISIFRNTSSAGAISFASQSNYPSGNGSIGVSVNDMNGDGKPDIIVCSGNSGFISIFINTTTAPGTITFANKQDFTIYGHADNLFTADLDNDGRADIITSNFGFNSISIFRNQSINGNLFLAPYISFGVGTNPTFVTTGDLDNDSKLDVIVTNYSSSSITLLKNESTTGNISLGSSQLFVNSNVSNVSISDLNGDGKPDMCTGRGNNGNISALENTNTGPGSFTFGSPVDFTTGNFDTYTSGFDIDGDGKPELAVSNTLLNNVTILKNIASDPDIDSLSLLSAGVGSNISIIGTRFSGATSVKFGGTPASSFNVVSSTKIDAVVGGGASGNVTVTTPSGTGVFAGFNFIPVITTGGPTTFCNEGSVTLTSSASANNQWFKDGSPISGTTAVTFEAVISGVYSVKTTSNSITTTSSNTIPVTVIVIPTPTISLNASNDLVSSATAGNQWYLNGTLITGATNQVYHPTQNGSYTVRRTENGCTSSASVAYNYLLTAIINLGNDQYIKTYPNPVLKDLIIYFKINNTPFLNLSVTDLSGRKIWTRYNIATGAPSDLSHLASGVYILRIYDKDLKVNETMKFIKRN